MKRILIIGDSMAMPRNEVIYEETWVYKLMHFFSNIHFIDKTHVPFVEKSSLR